ncbi:hypothetical protein [Pseudomonas sp. CBZ-4]|jgi:hypothetical protein|uniref:hypothetical protein n=1 Tax=Pseudomonas sp. CBZ-4 TaxID=1163065 RepID=UPI000371DD19|nr:hypothetical protein [Pseudomonas sp. CBZ-4]
MANTDIHSDGKKSTLSAYERKMARQRPEFISQDLLDKVVREHSAFFKSMRMDKHVSL